MKRPGGPSARQLLESRTEFDRAVERARAVLQIGDRLRVERCGGSCPTYTMTGWDGRWITSASRDDLAATSVIKRNGQAISFRDPPGFVPPPVRRRDVWRFTWSRWKARAAGRWTTLRILNLPSIRLYRLGLRCWRCNAYHFGWTLLLSWRGHELELMLRHQNRDEVPF